MADNQKVKKEMENIEKEKKQEQTAENEAENKQADAVKEELETEVEVEDTDEVEEVEATDTADESKEKKSFFKKKDKKRDEKDKKDEKIDELNDRLMRTMAEFDNFRKRTEREKAQMFEVGAKDIIEKILPIVDNFERGLAAVADEDKESAFVQGIELIYKQLINSLESAGVKPIDAVGKEFDPNLHNAVMHAEDDSMGENIVAEEFQKGYMYRDSVVRHSMVKVVN